MIFAVFDVLLAVNMCINYSFFTFMYKISTTDKTFWCTDNFGFMYFLHYGFITATVQDIFKKILDLFS